MTDASKNVQGYIPTYVDMMNNAGTRPKACMDMWSTEQVTLKDWVKTVNTKYLTIVIEMLKADIAKLKAENIDKVNEWAKIHLLEMDGLQKVKTSLKHTLYISHISKCKNLEEKEVNEFKPRMKKLSNFFALKESSDSVVGEKN